MARWTFIFFTILSVLAGSLTYYNVGLEETTYASNNVRSGSTGGFYSGGGIGGGYRHGK